MLDALHDACCLLLQAVVYGAAAAEGTQPH